jgi:hypothetical protein
MKQPLTTFDLLIIFITALLFIIALFVKGLTKELLLEAGVLLVSIKLIVMNYKTTVTNKQILKELEDVKTLLKDSKK